jgi:hypothetical protein
VALTCDEVSTINNGSYISIHAYVVKNWSHVPYPISLHKVLEGFGLDNLTHVIIDALRVLPRWKGLQWQTPCCALVHMVLAFSKAQKWESNCKFKLSMFHSHALGVRYMVHHCNLAFKTLSRLDIMRHIEGLLKSSHVYFKHSPKRHLEFVS